jgi:hypothetical protein
MPAPVTRGKDPTARSRQMAEADIAVLMCNAPNASPYLWIPLRTLEQARRDIARLRKQASGRRTMW